MTEQGPCRMPFLASGEVSVFQVPGAILSRCEAGLLRGTYERCRGVSTDQTHISVVTDEMLTIGLKSWSRGQKSQAASAICSGGVSAVIGSSDLDEHTLGSCGASGNQLSCSLPFEAERPIVGPAWQAQTQVCDEGREARGSISRGRRSSEPTTPSRDF